ncbi:MAG: hypothetical protein JXQ73_17080 [Phycisphaerae bacterium]|nr:hypothetical protein [Phycisphaerae bacterium]
MQSTRRSFLGAGLGSLAATLASGPFLLGATEQSKRKELAHRRRRIIFNDDGDDVWDPHAKTPEGFVGVRLKHMLDTQVDTLFYCTTQSFNYFTHNTKIGQVFLSRQAPFGNNNMQALMDAGTDPLRLAIEYAHKHGIEAVWTLRMNDIHDAFTPPLWPKWKTDHPDALLGRREDWAKFPPGSQHRWWSGVDFARADVRRRTLELIEDVATDYDVDAIDLDWLRHPIHFRQTLLGKPVTRQQIELITGVVRDARKLAARIGDKRGRPILLSARVPMTITQGLYIGTDAETWLKEGLIDLLTIGGGYVPFSMPTGELASLARRHEVPVYPCISASGMTRRKPYGSGGIYGAQAWRATASNAFDAKADGVSLFNLFPQPGADQHNELVRQVFSQAGEPATLAGKDKLFCLDNAAHMAGCGYTNHIVPYAACLPKPVEPGKTLTVTLPVGDDATRAKSITLRVQTDKPAALEASLNGARVPLAAAPELDRQIALTWQTAPVTPSIVKRGANRFEVKMGGAADQGVALTGLELMVRYG